MYLNCSWIKNCNVFVLTSRKATYLYLIWLSIWIWSQNVYSDQNMV